ncbi:MAG: hypothetical protein ACXVBJ_13305 [Flavisolibacter sp.]
MSEPLELTILDRELKIKFYPGNDLLEVLGISQTRGKGFNAIIEKIANAHKDWILEEVLNYALVNETENSNEELFLLTEYLSHRSLKNGYMLDVIAKIFTRSGGRRY